MMNRDVSLVMKAACFGLVTLALCLGPGCRKSPEPNPGPAAPPKIQPKTSDVNATPAAAPPKAKPAVEVNQPKPAAAVAPAAPAKDMVPLDLKLPKAIYVGTPQNLAEIPNLRPLSKTPRPPFLVPAGTKLLSLKKPVTSSESNPIIGDIPYVTDGDKEGTDGSEVQLGPGRQHVTIDLEQSCEIYAIVVWHYHKQACVFYDVVVQVSKDKDFVSDVKTVFNNDNDNSSGLGIGKDQQYVETAEGELIDCLSQGSPKGRYVRLYSKGCNFSELNYYVEVEVYGKPVE
jgi:hypothetical protein